MNISSFLMPKLYNNYWKARRYLNAGRSKHAVWRRTAKHARLSKPALIRLEWFIFYETTGRYDATFTCRHFGIARKTFYHWKKRFKEDHLASLEEYRRTPRRVRQPCITVAQEQQIIALRKQYIRLGK